MLVELSPDPRFMRRIFDSAIPENPLLWPISAKPERWFWMLLRAQAAKHSAYILGGFAFYGGVPRRVIIDNPKTMVAFIGKGKGADLPPAF